MMMTIGGTELYIVPAVHFNHVFAIEVHNICSDPDIRPDAIAVELGPRTAASVSDWLRELGSGRLPVMLGLLKRNRMIRASYRDKALDLQKKTGRDLSELPPELLHKELGYSSHSLTCLSPTDSIIEAIRCGIELSVPTLGIDLDEMADGDYRPVSIQRKDANHDMDVFIQNNAVYAETQRDDEIDKRRETAIAARIKALLKLYHRVLFTCGMAHWLKIRDMINDTSVRPAVLTDHPAVAGDEPMRVMVHPGTANQYMDLFPSLTLHYQKKRTTCNSSTIKKGKRFHIDLNAIFYKHIKESYKKLLKDSISDSSPCMQGMDIEGLEFFEGYLRNLCLLDNRPVPDLFTIIRAASETTCNRFVRVLSDTFMKYPWVTPDQFPDLPILGPSQHSTDENPSVSLTTGGHQSSKYFFLQAPPPSDLASPIKIPFEWLKRGKDKTVVFHDSSIHTWLPWDRLVTSLSVKAIRESVKNNKIKKSAPFEGSMLNGLDVKSTIRAFSRGEEAYYVMDYTKGMADDADPINGFPVVWITTLETDKDDRWILLQEPLSYMELHIKNKTIFKEVANKRGINMIAVIAYGKKLPLGHKSAMERNIRHDNHNGIIVFQPLCWTNKQFAHWAELTDYRRNPFCNCGFLTRDEFGNLRDFYRDKYQIIVGEFDWPTTLILLAMPFAKEFLTVVVPEGYKISHEVYRRAKEFGIQVYPVSSGIFSHPEIERIKRCYLIPAEEIEPQCVYSKRIERIIGERQRDNIHLVPEEIINFGNMD